MPWEKQFDVDAALGKAMEAFWARGYAATSLRDLVDCMGIRRGSLYATYGDKRALFIAALRKYEREHRAGLFRALEDLDSPLDAIRGLFQAQVDKVAGEDAHVGCFLTNTALELAPHDAEIGRIVADSQRRIEDFLARMIAAGRTAGEIPAGRPARALAQALLASLMGMLVLSRSRPEQSLLQTIADDTVARLSAAPPAYPTTTTTTH